MLQEVKEMIKASLMSGSAFTVGSSLNTSRRVLLRCLRLLGYSPKRARELLERMEAHKLVRRLDDDIYAIPFPELIEEYIDRALRARQTQGA